MNLHRILDIFHFLSIRFAIFDFLAIFLWQSICLQHLWFTDVNFGILILIIIRNCIVYALLYFLLCYSIRYFLIVHRGIEIHGNGVWLSLRTAADDSPRRWISPKTLQPHLRNHCRPPFDFIDYIRHYANHKYGIVDGEDRMGPYFLSMLSDLPQRGQPLVVKAWPAVIYSFDNTDDQLWPHCSLVHIFAFVSCNLCPHKNRLYIFRASLLRDAGARTLYSRPLRDTLVPPFLYGVVTAYQCNGYLFLHVDSTRLNIEGIDCPILIYDLKLGQLIKFDTNLTHRRQLLRILPDPDQGDDPSILRLRVFDCRDREHNNRLITKFYMRQIDHSRSRRNGTVASTQEYNMGEYDPGRPLHSCDQVAFLFNKRRQENEGQNQGPSPNENRGDGPQQKFAIYHTRTGNLRFVNSMQDFLLQNEEYRKCSDRYGRLDPQGFDRGTVEPLIINEIEAMAARHSQALWRTPLQPPSLKYRALQEVFASCDTGRSGFNTAKDWRKWSGMCLTQHFEK